VEAIGPETFAYENLVNLIGVAIGCQRPLVHVPPAIGYGLAKFIGWWMRDQFLTREEISGLMTGLLHVNAPPAGETRLSQWISTQSKELGRVYASELARRRDRTQPYIFHRSR